MNQKRWIKLLPWALVVLCIVGNVFIHIRWRSREAKLVKVGQLINEISSANSEEEEMYAVCRMNAWTNSERIRVGIRAFDHTTGQEISIYDTTEGTENLIFVVRIRLDENDTPVHLYQIVLKKNSHTTILLHRSPGF